MKLLLLKETQREEAGGQCKMENRPVFKCHLLALLRSFGKSLKFTGSW